MPDNGLILAGARPIADYVGARPRQIYYWARSGMMPTFRIGTTLCADKAALRAWLAEQQAKHAAEASAEATART